MERKEILKRAHDEKLDEIELQVKDKSMMWSYIVMVIMASVFSFIRSEQGLPMMDLCATVSGSVCAAMTYRFIKTRNIYLVSGRQLHAVHLAPGLLDAHGDAQYEPDGFRAHRR